MPATVKIGSRRKKRGWFLTPLNVSLEDAKKGKLKISQNLASCVVLLAQNLDLCNNKKRINLDLSNFKKIKNLDLRKGAAALKRKIYTNMLEWKQKETWQSALLLQGARRVGKSYIAEAFARNEYSSHILIDFNRTTQEVRDMFLHDIDNLDLFFLKLSTYYNVKLKPRDSLIIFDEVQLFPRARSVIKYLVQDGRYDYLETGSLLSIKENVRDILIPSEEEQMNLYPMDFEEFLWATGNETMMQIIRDCFNRLEPLGDALHRKAMDAFRQYLIVGGMPQAVETYVKSGDFEKTDAVKRRILNLYRDDIQKHARGYSLKAKAVFDELPSQLKNQNRHFKLSALKEGARYSEYREPLFWLSDAMIVNCCYNATEPVFGLRLNQDRTILKCYMADTGLLENVVAQMLTASGHKLYFYTNADREHKENRMEIDFLIAKNKITNRHNISPIEVKSSKGYALSSLKKFMIKFNEQLHVPYVLHTGDVKEENGIVYLPLYMAMLL